jgi:PAS domain S-box-containing protein
MDDSTTTFFVYTGDEEYAEILAYFGKKGKVIQLPANFEKAAELYFSQNDSVLFLDLENPQGIVFYEAVISKDTPWGMIIGIASLENVESLWDRTSGNIVDILTKPVTLRSLKITQHRIHYQLNFCKCIERSENKKQHIPQKLAFEQIETERFIAVRQIVERLTLFINQIASDVQGGIRYFNELQYFVSIHDVDCKVIAANPTYHKHLGNRLNQNSWGIYCGKHGRKDDSPVFRSLKTGNVLDTKTTVQYKSGAKVPVIVHTAPIYNNDGEVELVLEVFAGTKEIERLSQEIRTTQQRYEQLFDAVPSKVVVLDRRFRITAENKQFRKDFGKHLGDNFFETLRPGNFPAYRDPISLTMKDGLPHQGEMVFADPNGIQYNMMTWTSPIKTQTGKLIQVIAILGDVTELRRLQTDLSRLGLMISTISHDLKGSLTGLDAGLYLIDKGFYRDRPAQIEEGLDVAQLMVDRIRKMVFDILYSSKERELEQDIVDVRDFADDIAANVENRIRAAMIRFDCVFEEQLGRIYIDVGLLRSSLINILDNAIEACIENSDEKRSRIGFFVKREASTVLFEIQDNGSGMIADTKGQIFDIFYSSKGRKGTGLGLYITRKAIQKHGGTISVTSHPGKGTRFEVRLPMKMEETIS